MNWYKVWIVVPGTDGDAENGPCEPTWWNEFIKAASTQEAIEKADVKCKEDWESDNEYGFSEKDAGVACPVCTGAEVSSQEEYDVWHKEMDEFPEPPFL